MEQPGECTLCSALLRGSDTSVPVAVLGAGSGGSVDLPCIQVLSSAALQRCQHEDVLGLLGTAICHGKPHHTASSAMYQSTTWVC